MDDGFLPWRSTLDIVLKNVLNNLHQTIKFTVEPAKFDNCSKTLVIDILDIKVLLHVELETRIVFLNTNVYTIIR